MKHLESRLQTECVRWARLQHPCCRKLLFSVPNGVRTTATQARIAYAEGLVSGVADLILLHPSGDGRFAALLIEMKTAKGKQSPKQKEWQLAVESVGIYRYAVAHSFTEFQNLINNYL